MSLALQSGVRNQNFLNESQSHETVDELLRRAHVTVAPATYHLVSLTHGHWDQILQNPELSPRRDAPFMLLRDDREVTLLLEEDDWRVIRYAARDAKTESGFRLVTLDIELDWSVVGFLAYVTRILADAGIAVGALSAFSRDHLLIKQKDLAKALRALGEHTTDLC